MCVFQAERRPAYWTWRPSPTTDGARIFVESLTAETMPFIVNIVMVLDYVYMLEDKLPTTRKELERGT